MQQRTRRCVRSTTICWIGLVVWITRVHALLLLLLLHLRPDGHVISYCYSMMAAQVDSTSLVSSSSDVDAVSTTLWLERAQNVRLIVCSHTRCLFVPASRLTSFLSSLHTRSVHSPPLTITPPR